MTICAACHHENPPGARFCNGCGAALTGEPKREQRKTVTVLFCDLAGSTALGERTDPEALRALLARYFERMKAIVETHGGSVEKFIGDAVMAVFGVPVTHEDDALRACRAAVEMRDALPALGMRGRIGVNTGEVVTGTEERLATGDAVNVAALLEQAAAPEEVLLGTETLRLVRAAVEVGEPRSLDLKGKSARVVAYPLLAVGEESERAFATPMVGRSRELQGLRDALARAVADRSCQLFTVLGSAGVGKSRLVAEFLAAEKPRVLRGRCLSYGEGITYWPVIDILKQLEPLPEGDTTRPLRSLLGETEAPATAEEIAWGFRKLLEQEAQTQPVVCVLDDLHWAEPTLLDLIEHVADLSRDAPLLLLCMARPELLERRPSWGGGKWNATTVLLEPLDAAETEQLLAALGEVPAELQQRIVKVAEGNPLFIEEMQALVHDSGGADIEVPPTIQALLAARLDQLDPAERAVLERGSVEGRTFHRGAVAALADGEGDVDQRLLGLVRKELVRPDRAQLSGDDAYRFRHLLIRDAAYDALPKATRAELHRRFAVWLGDHGKDLVELDEIVGYHLEQAARYLGELNRPDRNLALEAGDRLAAGGERAFWRGDPAAAAALLERALTLTRPYRLDVHRELKLADSLTRLDVAGAIAVATNAERSALSSGDAAAAAVTGAMAAGVRLYFGAEGTTDSVEALARAALPLLEARDDHENLIFVWQTLGWVANMLANSEAEAEAKENVLVHIRMAGHRQSGSRGLGVPLMLGPQPASEALAKLDSLIGDEPHPADLLVRAVLLAMLDRIDEAWASGISAAQGRADLGLEGGGVWLGEIAFIAGDYATAVTHMARACDELEARGETAWFATYAPLLGRALCALGRYDEGERLAQRGRELGAGDDAWAQAYWRRTQAVVESARGQHDEAIKLAQEAVDWTRRGDSLHHQGDAYSDLAQVLENAGRRDEAVAAWREALDRYQRKEIVPLARRTREHLAELELKEKR